MSMPSVLCRREGEIRQSVVVALEGEKAYSEKSGVAPLAKALRDLVGPRDELLVLAILNVKHEAVVVPVLPSKDYSLCEECRYIKFLLQQVCQRQEHYRHIFRPFYDTCKSSEVNFQLKVSAGYQPRDIIIEQANNTKATWIVIDRCFSRDMNPKSLDKDCKISLVGEDEDAMILKFLDPNDGSGTSSDDQAVTSNPELDSDITNFSPPSVPKTTCTQRENSIVSEPYEDSENSSQRLCDLMQKGPLQLSEENVAAITGGFMTKIGTNRQENSETYTGFVPDDQSQVLVKRFKGDSGGGVLEAEKRAAMCMCHNNILGLKGYHSSEDTTVLVFPFPRGRTLEDYLYGSRGKEVRLTFVDKMKIAIGIAKGIRYMHEECPRGPVAHCNLQPHNIILGHDLKPQISGFGRAMWLHQEQPLQFAGKRKLNLCIERCPDKDTSDSASMGLVKLDILSFGVLLLRLFCRKHFPRDDRNLINWAQPFLEKRAFHKLLDEDSLDLDMYGIYKVMTAATRCTKNRPSSRPCMSEVISILRGESSCAVQCSPSTESSTM